MFVPRATVILEGSPQPGSPRQPRKLEFAAGRASNRTTVPAGKKLEQLPDPFPFVMVQLMPAGCEVIKPLPLFPGMIEMLPWVKWNSSHAVMIAYFETPPTVAMMRADWEFTWFVDTVNVALVDPGPTVTLGGTVAAAVLSLDNGTTKPPDGAADVSVTDPVAEVPPTTSLGLTVTADRDGVVVEGVVGEGVGLTVQPERAAEAGVPDPSSTATLQSAGFENGSRSILKPPAPSLVPRATPFTVIVRLGAAVPSSRSLVPESSAREMRTVACAVWAPRTPMATMSERTASGRSDRVRISVPPFPQDDLNPVDHFHGPNHRQRLGSRRSPATHGLG
jgi:hypothetical protein